VDLKEYEFWLEDRIAKIKAINEQYDLEKNGYVAFSGGKDSTIVHYLLDMALPNNNIPRVFSNTGMEYSLTLKFVRELAKNDKRIIILNQHHNIKQTLEKYGYPFKSKQHSHNIEIFKNNSDIILKEFEKLDKKPELKMDYNYIHNLPEGVKTIVKYRYGVRERERSIYFYQGYP
jgi:3'-phosphoadenosine 5'-phosphosulfate sulfotransferase (PAPS reductase)/FAD synthetase